MDSFLYVSYIICISFKYGVCDVSYFLQYKQYCVLEDNPCQLCDQVVLIIRQPNLSQRMQVVF